MNLKHFFLIICCFGLTELLFCQEYAVDKGASFVGGNVSFTSQGGDLFADEENNRATTFTMTPSINHFILKNFCIGGGIALSSQTQGRARINSVGVGPQIGYVFGKPSSTAFPYFDAGVRYYSMTSDNVSYIDSNVNGTDIFFGFGVLVPLKSHVGMAFEGEYHRMDLKGQNTGPSTSGDIFSIGIGIVGLLYK